ncbi:MAG: hypothetical protein NVS3B21_35600 [Acidimicrobiales bacterium]
MLAAGCGHASRSALRAPTSVPAVPTTDPRLATTTTYADAAPVVTIPRPTIAVTTVPPTTIAPTTTTIPPTTTTAVPAPTCALTINQGAADLRSDQLNATYWAHIHPDGAPGKDLHSSGTTNAAGAAVVQVKPPGDRPARSVYVVDVNFGPQADDLHPVCSVQFMY